MHYCTEQEAVGMIKDDMASAIIGDEYIEDPEERREKLEALAVDAVADACAEIDGYLSKRYQVPVSRPPKVLNKLAKDIAAYNLVSRMGVDEGEREKTFLNRYNAAIKFLLEVAKGTVSIGIDEENGSGAAANGFQMQSSGRIFSRESMEGW